MILSNVIYPQFSWGAPAQPGIEDNIKRLNWNGMDVVYIEDNRFPTYDLVFYFADGALSDEPGRKGLTYHAFNLLDSGTAKMSQKDILDQFEKTNQSTNFQNHE